jgi:hypothetical protein
MNTNEGVHSKDGGANTFFKETERPIVAQYRKMISYIICLQFVSARSINFTLLCINILYVYAVALVQVLR